MPLLPALGAPALSTERPSRSGPGASRCSSRSAFPTTTTTARCTCPRRRAASRPPGRRTAGARRLDAGRALARRPRPARAPAHGRPRLRLPARLVARRTLDRLRLLPRRRGRAAAARSRERAELGRSRRTAPSTSSRAGRPTATRIAFVSTAFEGRFHVFRLDVTDGIPGAVGGSPRTTTPALPRYYYSRFDHYLSPTWSPDGTRAPRSSRTAGASGAAAASGACSAEPGAPLRAVHDEETDLEGAARLGARRPARRLRVLPRPAVAPALADDRRGRRRVPAHATATSTRRHRAGRPTAGASPTSRTRAASRRCGRSACRAASGGKVEIRERRRLRRDRPPARRRDRERPPRRGPRSRSRRADGRSFVPDGAWRHADDSFDRAERRIEYGYFHTTAAPSSWCPQGR